MNEACRKPRGRRTARLLAPLAAWAPLALFLACNEEGATPKTLSEGTPTLGASAGAAGDASADARVFDAGEAGAPLATGLTAPSGLALDSTYVYFTQTEDGGLAAPGSVVRVPRAGGDAGVLASGEPGPGGIAVVGSSLVWGNQGLGVANGGMRAVDLSTATVPARVRSISAGEAVGPGLAHSAAEVYWASSLTGAGFVTSHATPPLGAPVNAGSTADPFTPAGLAVGDGGLYVAANEVGGALYRSDLAGGNLENLGSFPAAVLRDVVLVGAMLYLSDARDAPEGTVWRLPESGGVPVVFATGLPRPTHLALDPNDPTSLYVSLDVSDGSILRYPLTGGPPTVVAAHLPWPGPLVVDDAIYVATRNSVVKLLK